MAVVAGQKPGYEEHFNFLRSDRERFDSAHFTHDEYELYNKRPMARGEHLSYKQSHQLRDTNLFVISAAAYDRNALTYCSQAFESLAGTRTSDILLIVEHPLAIVPDDCGPARLDSIARAIGTRAGLRVVDSHTTLASTEVIERAIEVAKTHGYTAEAVLGVVIHSVALKLNSHSTTDLTKGVDLVAQALGRDVNLLSLYHNAHRVSSYSPSQLTTLQAELSQAVVAAGLAPGAMNPRSVNLYARGNLLAVLNEIPEKGNDILGFLACFAAPERPTPRTLLAVPACYEAWGGRFSAMQLHQSALLMAKHLTSGVIGIDWASNTLIHDIKTIISSVREEAVNRCVDLVVSPSHAPRHIVVVAEPSTAFEFNSAIAQKLT
jgi:hypothetical protein